jgi:hypothetical protein
VYVVIAVWGFILGSDGNILGFIPVNTEDNVLHAIIGLAGLGAWAASSDAAAPASAAPCGA